MWTLRGFRQLGQWAPFYTLTQFRTFIRSSSLNQLKVVSLLKRIMGQGSSTPEPANLEEYIRDADPTKQKEFEDLVNIDNLRGFKFPFKNIVMEGGGVKGIAYCGALKIFEDLGIMDKMTKIAGTSAGAITATLLSVGYSSDEIMKELKKNLAPIFKDSSYFGSAYNIVSDYGAYKSEKYVELMKSLLLKKTGNSEITFREVYDKYHKELCIIVTDITTMSTGFCHPKTTPDRPIWEAARMSMSIPGMMTPFVDNDSNNFYVDGGMVRNYPLQVFDGWYLSMEPENSFVMKLSDIDKDKTIREWQFGTGGDFTSQTVGLMLFSGYENEYKKDIFIGESGARELKRPPGTKLSKKEGPDLDKYLKSVEVNNKVIKAIKLFLSLLKTLKLKEGNLCDVVSREELGSILGNKELSKEQQALLLFNKEEVTVDSIMKAMTGDPNAEQIGEGEFFKYYMKNKINLQAAIDGSSGQNKIKSYMDFISAILSTIDLNEKMEQLKVGDVDRTIGVYTDYLSTTDFDMEDEDKKFLIKQGMISTVKFLKKFKAKVDSLTNE